MTENRNVVILPGIELHGILDAPQIQADGISQVMVGTPNVKILFHQLVGSSPNPTNEKTEIRKVALSLVISLHDAIQMSQSILAAVKRSEDEINRLRDEQIKTINEALDNIKEIDVSSLKR